MKNLMFRKVKIVKGLAQIDNVNGASPKSASKPSRMGIDGFHGALNKKMGKCLVIDPKSRKLRKSDEDTMISTWMVLDADSGDILDEFDDINQARQFCIKNDYDFGQYQ